MPNTANPKKHLYIIGNGFDRHHDADSNYSDFRRYLERVRPDIVADFEAFFGEGGLFRGESSDALWADFEQNLSGLNREKVFDFVDIFLPKVDEDHEDFSVSDYYAATDRVDEIVTRCTTDMLENFHKWINTLHYKHGFKRKMVELNQDALFLNFNYTLYLENEYHISPEQILYIHGDRRDKIGDLVLGHNIDDSDEALERWIHKRKNRRRYRPNLKDKKGRYFPNDKLVYLAYFVEDEDVIMRNSRLNIRYYAIDRVLGYLESYYDLSAKHSNNLIDKHSSFFASLAQVEEITVLGHSLSEVDMAYFEKIVKVVGRRAKWSFSYYNEKDIIRINKFCRRLNIPKPVGTQLFKMEYIIRS